MMLDTYQYDIFHIVSGKESLKCYVTSIFQTASLTAFLAKFGKLHIYE